MHYSKLYILTELSANDVKLISVYRQKLDLLIYIYLWYSKFYVEIQPDFINIKMTLVYTMGELGRVVEHLTMLLISTLKINC